MEQLLEWARGPCFRASLIIMVLGLFRVLFLNTVSVVALARKARRNQRPIRYGAITLTTLKWMFPFKKVVERRLVFSLTSMVFHVAAIITPLFLSTHILLWERGLGIRWAAIPNSVADVLTLLAVAAAVALFVERVGVRASRSISRAQDYLWPLLIALVFLSGYLAMHQPINPIGYHTTLFFHVMSANLVFILIPFSKLSHIILFPFVQAVSELGLYLEPQSDRKVMLALNKENESI
jgi:hypothetical protein